VYFTLRCLSVLRIQGLDQNESSPKSSTLVVVGAKVYLGTCLKSQVHVMFLYKECGVFLGLYDLDVLLPS
jgi:hypothetical protein